MVKELGNRYESKTDALLVSEFEPGTKLLIALDGMPVVLATVLEGFEGQALVRPAIGGQRTEGYRSGVMTLGTTEYVEGSAQRLESQQGITEVEWGLLRFGNEFVMRYDEDGGAVMFTGQQLDFIVVR